MNGTPFRSRIGAAVRCVPGRAIAALAVLCMAAAGASQGAGWQVPGQDQLALVLDRVAAQPRPRGWPRSEEIVRIETALRAGERRAAFERLAVRVAAERDRPGLGDLLRRGAAPLSGLAQKQQIDFETRQAQSAAFVWLIARSEAAGAEARRRALNLAALDPAGPTGVSRDMLSARHIVWTLALVRDWMGETLPAAERATLMQAVSVRMDDFHHALSEGRTAFEAWPWDSRANEVLGALAETSLLMLGETPRARIWVRRFVPLYLKTTLVWAGEDGGFASGTAYAGWDVGEYSLRHWDGLRRMAAIDLTEKPWVRNFGRFLVYFLPPGAPSGVFGDGAEERMPEVWARYAKAYAARVPDPLYRWYARQWFQEDPSALELLAAPVASLEQAELPAGVASSAAFPSVGWAAMHGDLRNRGRASVYFKSSPFGSLNHSHADQNSFVLHAGGRVLLADSGYYDDYNSAHQLQWARQTQAHNAVSFDGGQGQKVHDRAASGKLVDFFSSPALDWVTGDATAAYGPGTVRALRSVAYVRPDLVLVFDSLEAARPRHWEINLHAAAPFRPGAEGEWVVEDGGAQACIRTHASQALEFRQWRGFPAPPARDARHPRPDQAHARFAAPEAHARLTVVQAIRVNCAAPAPVIEIRPDGGVSVSLEARPLLELDPTGKLNTVHASR